MQLDQPSLIWRCPSIVGLRLPWTPASTVNGGVDGSCSLKPLRKKVDTAALLLILDSFSILRSQKFCVSVVEKVYFSVHYAIYIWGVILCQVVSLSHLTPCCLNSTASIETVHIYINVCVCGGGERLHTWGWSNDPLQGAPISSCGLVPLHGVERNEAVVACVVQQSCTDALWTLASLLEWLWCQGCALAVAGLLPPPIWRSHLYKEYCYWGRVVVVEGRTGIAGTVLCCWKKWTKILCGVLLGPLHVLHVVLLSHIWHITCWALSVWAVFKLKQRWCNTDDYICILKWNTASFVQSLFSNLRRYSNRWTEIIF